MRIFASNKLPLSTLICSFDGLHDNRVLRYYADFEAHILHMDTQTEAGEKVSVHFTGLLAHWFENVVQDNILFGRVVYGQAQGEAVIGRLVAEVVDELDLMGRVLAVGLVFNVGIAGKRLSAVSFHSLKLTPATVTLMRSWYSAWLRCRMCSSGKAST